MLLQHFLFYWHDFIEIQIVLADQADFGHREQIVLVLVVLAEYGFYS